ncbi:MAG: hypothetical protein ACT4OM_09100 [Actinomycetota bacterium]
MRKVLMFLSIQLAALGGTALPAYAHGAGGPDASNYKSAITGVTPATAGGVDFSIVANDALIKAVNSTDQDLTIIGYSEEPYLRIGPDGVFENRNSPATYLNAERFGTVDVPAGVSVTSEPEWSKIGDEPEHAWHDHRIHWMSPTLPPQVAADTSSEEIEIFEWGVPFDHAGERFEVTGRLDWIRPGSPLPWFAAGLALTSVPLLAGLTKPAGEDRKRALKRIFGAVLGVVVLLDIVHSVDDVLAVPATLGQNISASLQAGLFIALGSYGAWWAWRAGSGAWVGILLGGIGLALGIGATHLITLTSSQIATTLPEWFTRLVIASSAAVLVPAAFLAWRLHEPMIVESGPADHAH